MVGNLLRRRAAAKGRVKDALTAKVAPL